MARPRAEFPTGLELEILKLLWQEAPLPVREVRARLADEAGRELAHSSVITMLNIMVDKGYLRRRKRGKAFFFSPVVTQQETTRGMLGDLVDRAFDGSATAVMLDLLDASEIDDEELRELRRLINRKVRGQKK